MKFAYLSISDPRNKKVWSGTHYSIYKVLKSIGKVEILGPYEPKIILLFFKVYNQLSLKIRKERVSYRHGLFISRIYGWYFGRKLKNKQFDFIIAPVACAEIAHLKTNIPIIYITDGTFNSCVWYHESLTDITRRSEIEGEMLEQMAIARSKHIVVSSEWAFKSVVNHYCTNPQNVSIIPYGANFDLIPEEGELDLSLSTPFKLLFVGVNWKTKGAGIALNSFLRLYERGYDVALTIVGCEPDFEIEYDNLNIIKFIDKNTEEGQKQLAHYYKTHHLLVLPTRFDCTPIVINEASAYGLPSVVSRTGGILGHLKENVNGHTVIAYDIGELFSEEIEKIIKDPAHYLALRKSSRALYESTLNWEHWKKEFLKIIEGMEIQ